MGGEGMIERNTKNGPLGSSDKAGLPPGSLVHVGDGLVHDSKITVVDYNREAVNEHDIGHIDEILTFMDRKSVTWVNIEGLSDISVVEAVGRFFDIHPLVLEDILNTHQRPKFEEYDEHLYIVLKALTLETEGFKVQYEQVSILLMHDVIITFKEKRDNLFQPLRTRLQNTSSRIRTFGVDYLAYAMLDTIIDQNFLLLDSLDESVDEIEDELLDQPTAMTLAKIQKIKRELIFIRRAVSPLRDLLSAIIRTDSGLIQEKTHLYFRDVLDHVLRVTEAIESYRDILGSLLDIYISSVSNRMNEVMKVLTVFASIFIPLTFIVGIYGMNFDYMPELHWKWAYPTLWLLLVAIPAGLIVFFKKRKWL